MKANRTWVFAPAREILDARWRRLVAEPDRGQKRRMFEESDSAKLDVSEVRFRDLHPGGRPNVAPGLLEALSALVGGTCSPGR